jgi:hypothetical protein
MTTDYDRDRPAPDTDPEHVDPEQAVEQDFALRNVTMSNALPGGGQPAAGAVVGSAGRLGMQPETDEEIVGGDEEDRATAVESAADGEESGQA